MTVLMECRNIRKEFKDALILDDINFKVQYNDKIGIVGSNGNGKTTLANIITRKIEPTSGEIIWNEENISIGYMKQSTDYNEADSTLSGGEKTKKRLKEILYGNYNMIILDEPTNALDYEGVQFLIKEIKKFKGCILIISHDRYFLDNTVNRIIEVENKKIQQYNGNYTYYREKKKKDFDDALNLYNVQEKERIRIDQCIDNLKEWSSKGHAESAKKAIETGNKFGGKEYNRVKVKKRDKAIKSKIKALEKLKVEGIDKPVEEKKVSFKINNAEKIGSVVIRAENISKKFGKKTLFENSSFYIKQGEKVGIYGCNGCGKTTLIKSLLNEMDVEGNLYISPKRKIGYVSQDVENFKYDKTILELFNFENRKEQGEIRTKLNLLGFDKDSLNKKVSVLSLGERMKLKILTMIENECDILILDEPTNHIDIHVREKLEEMLEDYNGTILLITHDRYMLKKICNKVLAFEEKKINRYEYDFESYLNKKLNNISKQSGEAKKYDKLMLENRISYVLSKLSVSPKDTEEYKELDKEFNNLIKLKNAN